MDAQPQYAVSLVSYQRRKAHEVNIGGIPLGGEQPIRVQSMTTVDTMDTKGSIDQCIRMIDSGCEYIRITAPSIKEAQNLEEIRKGLRAQGYKTPLIADIHFTPNAAELAARIVEKVRVNPGNYADKKKFDIIEYTDDQYQEELDRIREKFLPLIQICKENGTAMRIGTNHGSLSDRIMSRYGDTPLGMVESALEFLRICEEEDYDQVVLSMKASNTQVMVQAYRLLVQKLDEEGLKPYPLHLGVTEAGEGEDGRIKSAVGIGTLLEDGLGDTVRVSLTEEPEFEAPVAKMLIDRYEGNNRPSIAHPHAIPTNNPYQYERRVSNEILNVGGKQVPRVVADLSRGEVDNTTLKAIGYHYLSATDKYSMTDLGADFAYVGDRPQAFLPNGLKQIVDSAFWSSSMPEGTAFPLFQWETYERAAEKHAQMNFVRLDTSDVSAFLSSAAAKDGTVVVFLSTREGHAMSALRNAFYLMGSEQCTVPVIVDRSYEDMSLEQLQIYASTDVGGLLIDGFGDGVLLAYQNVQTHASALEELNNLSFGILQAARTRMSKTEYISCPSCGRTLFDLQETTAMIRKRTDHLKGVKIGIMGCIVNGPGEMADADYGYVGSGPGKITLYRGQEVVKRGVPSASAVDELIEIIREDGNWIEQVAESHQEEVAS